MALESADQVKNKTNQQKLDDIHWDVRGPGQGVPKFGDDGKVIGGTSVAIEIGWIATNFWRVMRELGEIKGILRSLALGQGVAIDYDEIARKVADEQARRLTSGSIDVSESGK